MQEEADGMIHQAENRAHHAETMDYQAVQQTDGQMGNIVQDVNNNYVQH